MSYGYVGEGAEHWIAHELWMLAVNPIHGSAKERHRKFHRAVVLTLLAGERRRWKLTKAYPTRKQLASADMKEG